MSRLYYTLDGPQPPPVDEGLLRMIRGFQARDTGLSWLELVWDRESERFIFYQCIPAKATPTTLLAEPIEKNGRIEPDPGKRVALNRDIMNDYQQQIYDELNVWSYPFFIVQGWGGGHKKKYGELEKALCVYYRLSQDPPEAGQLPFAPVDYRTIRALNGLDNIGEAAADLKKSLGQNGFKEALRDANKAKIAQMMAKFIAESVGESLEEAGLTRQESKGLIRRNNSSSHDDTFEKEFHQFNDYIL